MAPELTRWSPAWRSDSAMRSHFLVHVRSPIGYNTRMRNTARLITVAMLVVLTSCADQNSDQNDTALRPFYEQTLDWRACAAPAPADAQCGTIRVPRDYADPRGVTWEIAVSRLPTTGQKPRLGSIVTNPGGPGISGVAELLTSDDYFARLRTQYDVVSFDPRGVGSTDPALDCLTEAQATAIRNQVSAPATAAEQALAFDLGREHALACERAFGESLGRVGTREVARDMDVLRAVLGEDKLDYFGFSYGTYLGAVYAELFPGRTDRVVLDSAMNPANSYERLRYDQALAQQASIERFAADCPTHADCPLAADVPTALAQIAAVIHALDTEPFVGADGRVLSGSRLLQFVESSMYAPESGWPTLRAALGPGLAGDLDVLLAAAYGPGQLVNPADSPYLAVMCHDLQVGRDPSVIPGYAAAWAQDAPLTGAGRAWTVLPCTEWRAKSDVLPAAIEARDSGDILVIGVTGDPATPVGWARALASTLAHGRLLEWQGDGHIAYGRGGACVDNVIEGFFLDGVLPPEDTRCPLGVEVTAPVVSPGGPRHAHHEGFDLRADVAVRAGGSSISAAKGKAMKQNKCPAGWDKRRVQRVLAHYENQTDEEAVAEDETAYEDSTQGVMRVPWELVPSVREILAERRA